jgi:cysteinyl-tRNA synthetase
MALRLYNTRTRAVEPFRTLEPGHARIYVCGLTPSAEGHLGHARSFLFFDVLRRYLEHPHNGYRVTYVKNVTDIDDRAIATAKAEGTSFDRVVARFYESFRDSMRKLGVREPDQEPYATHFIPQIVEMIAELIERGFAYVSEDGIYYDVAKFPRYGALSGKNVEELLVGARIAENEHKRDPLDFALWKFAKPDEPRWESPWGAGRPGWHIECSAMARSLLGVPFDLHGGGYDLIFPHHENEIAQSEPLMDAPPMAVMWLHGGLLNFEGRKMSKSLGNFEPLSALLVRHDPLAIRLLFLTTGYQKPMNFTEESIAGAKTGLERLQKAAYRLREAGRRTGRVLRGARQRRGHVACDQRALQDRRRGAVPRRTRQRARGARVLARRRRDPRNRAGIRRRRARRALGRSADAQRARRARRRLRRTAAGAARRRGASERRRDARGSDPCGDRRAQRGAQGEGLRPQRPAARRARSGRDRAQGLQGRDDVDRRRPIGAGRPEQHRRAPRIDLDDVIYGVHAVDEMLVAGEPLRHIHVGDDRKRDPVLKNLLERARAANVPVRFESRAYFATFPYKAHQGVVAFGEPFEYVSLEEVIEAGKGAQPALYVVLDHVTDPHNVGAIIRSAESAGATAVILPERRSAGVNPTVRKSSAGATAFVPIARVANISQAVRTLKKAGIWVYGAALGEGSTPYTEVRLDGPVALVIGAEGEGIAPLVRRECDGLVSIPMLGQVGSLNASVAAGVLLYEAVRQRSGGAGPGARRN